MPANHTFNVVMVESEKGVGATVTANSDCVIPYTGALITGCPVGIGSGARIAHSLRNLPEITAFSAGEHFQLPAPYTAVPNQVKVYSLSGRLLRTAMTKGQSISLRKDFNLPNGAYIINVRVVPEAH